MTNDELIARLAATASARVPDPGPLIARAFPEVARKEPRSPLLSAAVSTALVVAGSTPVWTQPSQLDRERTETMVAAAAEAGRQCLREWNRIGGKHD